MSSFPLRIYLINTNKSAENCGFVANDPILHILKTHSRKPKVSDVFKGYKIGTLARNGLIKLMHIY